MRGSSTGGGGASAQVGDAGAGGVGSSLGDEDRSAEAAEAVPVPLLDAGEAASCVELVDRVGVGAGSGTSVGAGGSATGGGMVGATRLVGVVGVVVADVEADVEGVVVVVVVVVIGVAALGRRKFGIWLRGCECD